MNIEKIQKRMEEYWVKTTPEQLIEQFQKLGVEFVDTKDLTIAQQLQLSPKWKEFLTWYEQQFYEIPYYNFADLPFEFQKGVFEKFIKDNCHIQRQIEVIEYYLWTEKTGKKYFESFEELLIYYFNI